MSTPVFQTQPPLQPKRVMVETPNLACIVLRWSDYGSLWRFLNFEFLIFEWGYPGGRLGVAGGSKIFFDFSIFFDGILFFKIFFVII